MTVVILDSGPLGMIVHPGNQAEVDACQEWFGNLLTQGACIILPEIVNYEIRRELLRLKKTASLLTLDRLSATLEYLPLTTEMMRHAADLWAQVRQQGKPTSDAQALDVDVILAAQALSFKAADTIVATTNVGHLSRFVTAKRWQNI
jgi:predicted nucleic acid-binding protein